jgi:hypothetical protein
MALYNKIESNIRLHSCLGVKQLLRYFGIEVIVQKLQRTVYTDVYGVDAGGPHQTGQQHKVMAVVSGDDFFQEDASFSGNFQQGWMIIDKKDEHLVSSGDNIKIVRDDGTSFRYKVGQIQSIGLTTKIFKKYELVSIGD